MNRYLDWQSDNPWLPIGFYAPVISFLSTFVEPRGAQVVEVGTGIYGIAALSYMGSKGVRTTAIDHTMTPPRHVIEKSGVRFLQDKWENIAAYLPENSADVIYIQFMYPNPQEGGQFCRAHPFGTSYHEEPAVSMRREDKARFIQYVGREMLKVLKPDGVFFACSNNCEDLPSDFSPSQRSFEALGYREHEFRLPDDSYYKRDFFVAQKV